MGEELILRSDRDGLCTLTLNRPDKLNALNQDLRQRIKDALHDLADDPDIKVAIIHGTASQ